jgi:hypothetical protein
MPTALCAAAGARRPLLPLLVLLSFLSLLLKRAAGADPAVPLRPDVPLNAASVQVGGQLLYAVGPLAPSTAYEVRISYPAVTPVDFLLEFVQPGAEDPAALGSARAAPGARRLLNTAKLMFATDAAGRVALASVTWPPAADGTYLVRATARPEGVAHSPHLVAARPLLFNVVLESLPAGAPAGAWRMIVLLAVVLLLLCAGVLPRLLRLFDEPRSSAPLHHDHAI